MLTSTSAGGTIWLKWMLKPWANMSVMPAFRLGADVALVEARLHVVRHQHHDGVGVLGGLGRAEHLEAGLLGARRVGRARQVADDHAHAAVAQVLGVSVSLAAEADDGDRLAADQAEVGVIVVVHGSPSLSWLPRGRQWFPECVAYPTGERHGDDRRPRPLRRLLPPSVEASPARPPRSGPSRRHAARVRQHLGRFLPLRLLPPSGGDVHQSCDRDQRPVPARMPPDTRST